MKNNFCARKTRQLSYRVKLLKNYSANSEKSDSKIQKLISEIKELIQSLKFSISRRRIRKIVGSAAVLLGLGLGPTVQAQQFASEIINPFGIMLATDSSWPPTLCDFDGDEDGDADGDRDADADGDGDMEISEVRVRDCSGGSEKRDGDRVWQ